jgi:hypothetical protein
MKVVFDANDTEKTSLCGHKCAHNSPSLGLGHMHSTHIHTSYFFKILINIILLCKYLHKKEKLTGGWRKVRNEELHNIYPSRALLNQKGGDGRKM